MQIHHHKLSQQVFQITVTGIYYRMCILTEPTIQGPLKAKTQEVQFNYTWLEHLLVI
jgi:hypothetical protein